MLGAASGAGLLGHRRPAWGVLFGMTATPVPANLLTHYCFIHDIEPVEPSDALYEPLIVPPLAVPVKSTHQPLLV